MSYAGMSLAMELARAYQRLTKERWSYVSPFAFEDVSDIGGGSTDGGFNFTLDGRRFSVTVHEYEPEDE